MIPSFVEDRLMIDDLFVRYTCALDEGDVESVVGCFTEDASLESPAVGRFAGHAAIRTFARRFAAFREGGAQLRHAVSNMRVEFDGNRAKARCYLIVFLTCDGSSRLLPPGVYECDLVKRDGRWLFQHRRVSHDHAYALEGL